MIAVKGPLQEDNTHPGIKCHLLACLGDDKLPVATALHLQLLPTAALVQFLQHLHTGNHGNFDPRDHKMMDAHFSHNVNYFGPLGQPCLERCL